MERNWRYAEFRGLAVTTMKEILNDAATTKIYETDPFNPHAIARLRLSAYQQWAVTSFIRNELDWGDALFAEETLSSRSMKQRCTTFWPQTFWASAR